MKSVAHFTFEEDAAGQIDWISNGHVTVCREQLIQMAMDIPGIGLKGEQGVIVGIKSPRMELAEGTRVLDVLLEGRRFWSFLTLDEVEASVCLVPKPGRREEEMIPGDTQLRNHGEL